MKKPHFLALAIWALCLNDCFSQSNCNDPKCTTNSLIINTGWNHSNGTVFADGQQDPYWILTNAPTDVIVNLNGPANVIASGWGNTIDNNTTKFISAFPTFGSNASNISLTKNPYSFERCFCTCGTGVKVDYDMIVRADNRVLFFLDNVQLPNQPPLLSMQSLSGNFDQNDNDGHNKIKGTITLNAGRHCLRAELRNDDSLSRMGLNIKGTLTTAGSNLLKETFCNNTGFVVGYKYKDDNCNGVKDSMETILPNWQIKLTGGGLNLSSTTDANGYYTFSVPQGTYTISEVLQSGWSGTSPIGGIKNDVVVSPGSITQIDFLNCNKPPTSSVSVCCPQLKNLIVNPSFENKNPPLGFSSQYTYDNGAPATNSLMPGEQAIITPGEAQKVCSQWTMKNSCSSNFLATNGANNQSTGPKLVWQETMANLKSGSEYKFCAKVFNLRNCCFAVTPKIDIKFSIPGNDLLGLSIDDVSLPLDCDFWRQIEKRFIVPTGTNSVTIQIFLYENSGGDGNDLGLDDIALVELPQTAKSRTDFTIKAVNRNATTVNYIATANDANLKDCGVWWKVCEYDPNSPDRCKSGTAMENPSEWWTYPTPVQFWGFNHLNPSVLSGTNIGVFDAKKTYLFELGVFCPCTGWNSTKIAYDLKANRMIPVTTPPKR